MRSGQWVFMTLDHTKGTLQMPFAASEALPDQTPRSSRPTAPQCFLSSSRQLLLSVLSHARRPPSRRRHRHPSCCKSSTWTGLRSGSETRKCFPLLPAFAKWPRTLRDLRYLHGGEVGAVIGPIFPDVINGRLHFPWSPQHQRVLLTSNPGVALDSALHPSSLRPTNCQCLSNPPPELFSPPTFPLS